MTSAADNITLTETALLIYPSPSKVFYAVVFGFSGKPTVSSFFTVCSSVIFGAIGATECLSSITFTCYMIVLYLH